MKHFNSQSLRVLAVIAVTLFCFSNSVFSQGWQWARSQGSTVLDRGKKVCTDASGNVYVAGEFSVSISIGTISISGNGNTDVFLAKYDPSGNVLWAKGIGGTGAETVGGIATSTAGDIAVFGSFQSPSFTVAPFSVSNATTSGTSDIFICRFSSIGATQFLTAYGNAGNQYAKGCSYDASNYLWIGGDYSSANFTLGSYTLTNSGIAGTSDIFFAATSTGGSITSAYDTGGPNSSDYLFGLDTYSNNSVYLSGSFGNSTTTIGSQTLTSYGLTDAFLAKYNGAGGFQWARNGGGPGTDESFCVTTDPGGNVIMGGYYSGGNMTIGTQTLTNVANTDCFLAKYTSAGVFSWSGSLTGTGFEYVRAIATNAFSEVFVTGNFGSATLSTSTLNLTNTTAGMSDVFVVKYNSTGGVQWGVNPKGTNSEFGYGLATDGVGNLYVTGHYNIAGPTAFATTTLTSAGADDSFLAKIGCITMTLTGSPTVCAGSSVILSASGSISYTWSTGQLSGSIAVTPTATTVYSVSGASGSCTVAPLSITVTPLPNSLGTGSAMSLLCKQKSATSVTCSPSASTVTWTPATNLSSTSVLNPTVTGGPGSTNYTVNVTLSNGCVKTGTLNVSTYAQTPDICQVTVDSLSNYNEIYWEKTLYPQADSFIVYRETSTNVYTRIAGLSRTALSMYIDTNRSIGPANGNPNLTYYRYKIQIKDSCGNASPLSKWHETIFIQDQMNGNFNWNMYAIESATSTPVSIYNLKRRTMATGTETLVTSTTGGLATDPLYNSFWPLNITWLVDAVGFNCNATAKTMVLKTKTKSNQSNDKLAMGINYTTLANNIRIYPNPANDVLNVDLNGISKEETIIEIHNALGQIVYQTKSLNQHLVINTSVLSGGVYAVSIKQNNKTLAIKKVVVDK